jgi:putative transposase
VIDPSRRFVQTSGRVKGVGVPRKKDTFSPDNFFHVFNRAINGEYLIQSHANCEYCINLQWKYAKKFGIEIVAFCLMPNHYHFLVKQKGNAPLSKFFGCVFNAYVQAINNERNRTGPLFEGRFKHVWVDREEYLTHLCRYIHLSPVKAGIVKAPGDWHYSDYSRWISSEGGRFVGTGSHQISFETPEEYEAFVIDYLKKPEILDDLREYFLD